MKLAALLFTLCFTNAAAFRICSFNIQTFGEAKCAKPEVMNVIVKVVSRCDIMLLMEIKDSTDKAINILMAKLNSFNLFAGIVVLDKSILEVVMNYRHNKHFSIPKSFLGGVGQPDMKDEFDVIISQRLGRKTYKEQYAFIYRKQLVAVKASYQYLDRQDGDVDAFSREPFVVWFQTYKNEFVIIPQHTTPEAAVREIDELYDVYLDVKQKWKAENFIFMGDFNAACGYVPKKYWKNIRLRTNQEFVWLIEDNVDTTVKSSTKCAYDRIVVHGKRLLNSVVPDSATVFDFMKEYGLTEAQALEISDHYPVEVKLSQMRKMKPSSSSR